MRELDPHLSGCRRNVRELADLLTERLSFHGMKGRAEAYRQALESLDRREVDNAIRLFHRAWADLIVGQSPDQCPRATLAADVDPDIGLIAEALRQAVGNLKVYVRYGMRRADVPLPDVRR